jgi:hypothetical protein
LPVFKVGEGGSGTARANTREKEAETLLMPSVTAPQAFDQEAK